MDLRLNDKLFVVSGASSGLGHAVALQLLEEGAKIIAIARTIGSLEELIAKYPEEIEIISGDVQNDETHQLILKAVNGKTLDGIFVNAGGPPAKRIAETNIDDWDKGYELVIRWKIKLVLDLLPKFRDQGYGRILFSESSSVKQPVDNLVLSNSLRLAIIGFAKTLSSEHAHEGITVNTIAPGYHETAAVERLFKKKMELEGVSYEEAKEANLNRIT